MTKGKGGMGNSGAFTVVVALTAGIMGQAVARHLRVPAIVVLLMIGVGIGPEGLHFIDPSRLGLMLPTIVGFAVAIILFEGGLQLEKKRLKRQAKVIQRLISSGAILTAVLASLITFWVMEWPRELAILFGTLVIVTGPTVVTPLLRRIKVNRRIDTILEAEGVLIDPVGAIIAVAVLGFVISAQAGDALMDTVIYLLSALSFGFAMGVTGGFFIGFSLKNEKLVPRELENIFTLAIVIFLFEISNQIIHESGIMAVTVAGVIVGNMNLTGEHRIIHFKEQLTVMLIGFLFVLLAADIKLVNVMQLGMPGVLVVVSLILVVRPLNVLYCARGTNLTWKEKIFMSWLAPRGIVAAAVASLFAFDLKEAGIDGGSEMRALVFLVIASTVILQGFTAGPLATLLRLRRKSNWGYVLIGANELARVLARTLSLNQEEVVLLDSSNTSCAAAMKEGFRVIYGSALDESVLMRAGINLRRSIVAVTPNNDLNIMVLKKLKELDHNHWVIIAAQKNSQLDEKIVKSMESRTLFGGRIDFNLWLHRLSQEEVSLWSLQYQGEERFEIKREALAGGPHGDQSILFLSAKRNGFFVPVFDGMEIAKNTFFYALAYKNRNIPELLSWLQTYQVELVQSQELDELKPVSHLEKLE